MTFSSNKLMLGIMYKHDPKGLIDSLSKRHERILLSEEFNFNFTTYYEKEFGQALKKQYLLFDSEATDLAKLKLECMLMEKDNSVDGKRLYNIDPGIFSETRFILASSKDRPHRIPIGNEIFGDLQLVFKDGKWETFTWTFPDVLANIAFFNAARELIVKEKKS